jgi:hypothetical protein
MIVEVEERARALAGFAASPLIQTLALTVALCEHDVRARQSLTGPTTDHDARQRHLDRSMRRYLEACKTPGKIQVNLAQNQVVASDGLKAVHGIRNRGR